MNRKLRLVSLLTVFLGIPLSILVNLLTGENSFRDLVAGIGTKGLVAVVIVVAALQLFTTYLQHHYDQKSRQGIEPTIPEHEFEETIRTFSNSLKERYRSRFEQKLDGRFEITLEVSEDFRNKGQLIVTQRFGKDPDEGEAVALIAKTFERQKRLLIVGNPGAGKTILLLKFANSLLEGTIDRSKTERGNQKGNANKGFLPTEEPFPVIFNLASWSAEHGKFEDWLIAVLVAGNGLSKDFAVRLLHEERIIFLLDGLDELARNEAKEVASAIRAACLKSLNQYLKYGRRVVICCRVDEFVQMREATGQDAPVSATIKICDLTRPQILLALMHAQEHERSRTSADNLLKVLEADQNVAFLDVLRSPFYFTTALEVFDQQILEATDFPTDEDKLKKYFLDRFVESKLEGTPNPRNFKARKTRKWLRWLARLLEKKQHITFELAQLQPSDLKHPWIFKFLYGIITFVFLTAPLAILVMAFAIAEYTDGPPKTELLKGFTNWTGSPFAALILVIILLIGIVFLIGAIFFLPFCLLFGFRTKQISTEDASRFSLRPLACLQTWKDILLTSVFYGLIALLLAVLGSLPQPNFREAMEKITPALLFLIAFILVERVSNYCRVVKKFVSLKKAYQRLKTGIVHNLLRWQLVLLAFILVINFFDRGFSWEVFGVRSALMFLPFTLVLSLFNTALLKHFMLRLCLTTANVVPARYATFLDYAADLRILEKDGGHWRFRHQYLQEYFAFQDFSKPQPANQLESQFPPNDGYAIASLVLGLFPLTCLPSLLAIVFGHIAWSRIASAPARRRGKGMALWGLGLGYFFTICNIIYGIVIFYL